MTDRRLDGADTGASVRTVAMLLPEMRSDRRTDRFGLVGVYSWPIRDMARFLRLNSLGLRLLGIFSVVWLWDSRPLV